MVTNLGPSYDGGSLQSVQQFHDNVYGTNDQRGSFAGGTTRVTKVEKPKKDQDPVIITHVTRKGTDMYPTYTVEMYQGDRDNRWKEHWDPWDKSLDFNKETKQWVDQSKNVYVFKTGKDNHKQVNDLTSRM